jgi:endonuclease YncB( thermonuclease family)
VRDLLREKILNKVVQVECDDLDKYGRLLTVIYIDGENVNQWLIDNDYAFAYDGGTKRSWEEYLENKTTE